MTQEPECFHGRRRGEQGLTALSWLLIIAAVAGLAALAVVLVQGEVQDVAQRIVDLEPRLTAATHSAAEVESDAKAAAAGDFASWADWESHHSRQCSLIAVLYADAEVEVVHNKFSRATGAGTAFDAAVAAAADEQPPTASKAQAQCEVS